MICEFDPPELGDPLRAGGGGQGVVGVGQRARAVGGQLQHAGGGHQVGAHCNGVKISSTMWNPSSLSPQCPTHSILCSESLAWPPAKLGHRGDGELVGEGDEGETLGTVQKWCEHKSIKYFSLKAEAMFVRNVVISGQFLAGP